MRALRRAERSATRSRCQEAGGAGATFQTPVSAAKAAPASRIGQRSSLENCIDPPKGGFFIIGARTAGLGMVECYEYLTSPPCRRTPRRNPRVASYATLYYVP